ncbi:MAG: energy-coupling factor transporter transmembrane protein EcfT [Lachnospiraceae bacterium]|nr:energy-coupling factor transporter transmembrane protein EcfT [Lachnospiraceae bacterium]
MLRDITLGQYYSAESKIHGLDPRTKLTGTFIFIISLFLFRSIATTLVATLFLVFVIAMSQVPLKFMLRGMKGIVFILLITVLFNLFLTPGIPVFRFYGIVISDEGIKVAVFTAIRLIYLIVGSSIMTLTTTPNNLTDGLEALMNPLKVFKVPVHEVAMMMSIALRFIPILMEETDKIMKAQEARGADFESGNVIQRAKSLVPVLVPLFVSAFRRANDLAMAMEARCYHGGEGRTKMKPLIYKKDDYMAYVILFLYIVIILAAGIFINI